MYFKKSIIKKLITIITYMTIFIYVNSAADIGENSIYKLKFKENFNIGGEVNSEIKKSTGKPTNDYWNKTKIIFKKHYNTMQEYNKFSVLPYSERKKVNKAIIKKMRTTIIKISKLKTLNVDYDVIEYCSEVERLVLIQINILKDIENIQKTMHDLKEDSSSINTAISSFIRGFYGDGDSVIREAKESAVKIQDRTDDILIDFKKNMLDIDLHRSKASMLKAKVRDRYNILLEDIIF